VVYFIVLQIKQSGSREKVLIKMPKQKKLSPDIMRFNKTMPGLLDYLQAGGNEPLIVAKQLPTGKTSELNGSVQP